MRRQKKELARKNLTPSTLFERAKTQIRLMTIFLFYFGLLLGSIGFLISHADNCQFIVKIISADSLKAERGIQILEEKQALGSNDDGFEEICKLYKNQMVIDNRRNNFSEISIEEIRLQKYAYENMDIFHKRPLAIKLSNGETLDGNIEFLTKQINDFKKDKLFKVALVVFAVGAIVSIFGFELKKKVVT
jgi:hypothetical protein